MSFRRAPLCGLDRGESFVISRSKWGYFCTLIAVIQPGTLDSYCMGQWSTGVVVISVFGRAGRTVTVAVVTRTWPSILSSLLAYRLFLVPPHADPTRCQL